MQQQQFTINTKFILSSDSLMDFQQLAQIIPKPTQSWTVSQTQKWIKFTGLDILAQQFQNLKIDGSCLHALTEEDFRNELGINSKIMMKKIMAWVNKGFSGYDQYLKQNKLGMTMKPMNQSIKYKQGPVVLQTSSLKKLQEPPQIIEKRQTTYSDNNRKFEENQLIIKQSQVPQANFFSFKNKGGTIGRNGTNEIILSDDFVSRFHAEVLFENQQFFIRDCGSNSGTYIRITQKKQLYNGIILQMGSNQFEVNLDDKQIMGLVIIDGPNTDFFFGIAKKDKITIGRKPHNEVNFQQDHHLSNIHATFFNVNGVWYVEDLGSTNGTWIRLSKPGIKSGKWKLQDKSQFKISTNYTYECRRNTHNRKTQKEKFVSQKCILCKQEDRNAIILPCKHNTCCYQCVMKKGDQSCESCGAKVTDIVKIFKV